MNFDFLELVYESRCVGARLQSKCLKCTGRRGHRQDDHKFEAILVYIAIFRLRRVI